MQCLVLVRDNPLAVRDDQDLLGRMVVPPVSRAIVECHCRDPPRQRVALGDQVLPKYRADHDIARIRHRLLTILPDTFHACPSMPFATAIVYRWSQT